MRVWGGGGLVRDSYETTTLYYTKEMDPEAYPSDMTGAPWFQGFNVSEERHWGN